MPVCVVYIMGNPRSGSTLLDTILGSHPEIESVGELGYLPQSGWIDDEYCACGVRASECSFCSEVRRRWVALSGSDDVGQLSTLTRQMETSRWWMARLESGRFRESRRFRTYAEQTRALCEAISTVSGKPVIVDSTKRRSRALALSLVPGIDLRVIHLVRDVRGVVWSTRKHLARNEIAGVARELKPRPVWRATIGWVKSNLQAGWVRRRLDPSRSIQVRYEDLVSAPAETLACIGRLIHADLSHAARTLVAGRSIEVGHNIAGNRLRMAGSVSLQPDMQWKSRLSTADQRTCWALAGWLMRQFGYEKSPETFPADVRRAA